MYEETRRRVFEPSYAAPEFPLRLPVADGRSEVASDGPLPMRRAGAETILVVEDEEAVRKVVRRILEKRGFHVLEASRGEDALSICEQHDGRIHLLLTDVVMPEMSGPEVASRVCERRGETSILYMSGYPKGVLESHGASTDRAPLILKPFFPQALVDKVRETIGEG